MDGRWRPLLPDLDDPYADGEHVESARGNAPTFGHQTYSGDAVSMYTHCGTHIDTLNHYGYDGQIWNCFEVAKELGCRTWHVCGAEKHPPIIARGIMIDVAALSASRCCLTPTASAPTIYRRHSIARARRSWRATSSSFARGG